MRVSDAPSQRNIKLTIEYIGKNYCGWQAQNHSTPQKPSIQRTLEKALSKLLREKIKLIGSGRTDAGVHAKAQVANFNSKSHVELSKLRLGVNALLPEDIAVLKAEVVGRGFNSRFDAKSKTYRYSILNRTFRSALLKDFVYLCPHHLDIAKMKKELRTILGRHDFRAFQAYDDKKKASVRTVKSVKITKSSGLVNIDIEADGFLYNMARSIAGTLIEVGRGRFQEGAVRNLLRTKDRSLAGPTVPAKGLCLIKVKY